MLHICTCLICFDWRQTLTSLPALSWHMIIMLACLKSIILNTAAPIITFIVLFILTGAGSSLMGVSVQITVSSYSRLTDLQNSGLYDLFSDIVPKFLQNGGINPDIPITVKGLLYNGKSHYYYYQIAATALGHSLRRIRSLNFQRCRGNFHFILNLSVLHYIWWFKVTADCFLANPKQTDAFLPMFPLLSHVLTIRWLHKSPQLLHLIIQGLLTLIQPYCLQNFYELCFWFSCPWTNGSLLNLCLFLSCLTGSVCEETYTFVKACPPPTKVSGFWVRDTSRQVCLHLCSTVFTLNCTTVYFFREDSSCFLTPMTSDTFYGYDCRKYAEEFSRQRCTGTKRVYVDVVLPTCLPKYGEPLCKHNKRQPVYIKFSDELAWETSCKHMPVGYG